MRGKRRQDGWLTAEWSKRLKDIVYNFPTSKRDARLLDYALTRDCVGGKSLQDSLVERGYDLTTLQFSIRKAISDETA